MKTKVKKRVVSRKKKPTKRVSTKRTAKSSKKKAAVKSRGSAAKKRVRGRPFMKGVSGNPKGRKKGSKNKFSVIKMQESLQRAASEAGYDNAYDYVAEQFFLDNHVLTSIMKKLLADLKSIEQIVVPGSSEGDKKKNRAIQKIIQERCKTEKKA